MAKRKNEGKVAVSWAADPSEGTVYFDEDEFDGLTGAAREERAQELLDKWFHNNVAGMVEKIE